MEDRFPGIKNEQGSEDDDSEERRLGHRGGANFVRRGIPSDALFRRIFENSSSDSSEEDEDEEEDDGTVAGEKRRPANKRFRRSFGRLFRRRIVDGPQLLPDENSLGGETNPAQRQTESVVPSHNFGDWLRRMSGDPGNEIAEPNLATSKDETEHRQNQSRISIAELLSRVSSEVEEESELADNVPTAEQLPPADAVSTESQPTVETPGDTVGISETGQTTSNIELEPIDQTESIQQILQRQSAAEAGGYNGAYFGTNGSELGNNNTTIVNETYNNVNGWGPALVVDQLSRHRDRKIKRHDKQQDKRIKEVEKTQANQHLESINNLLDLQSRVEKLQQNVVHPAQVEAARPQQNSKNERLASPAQLPEKFIPQLHKEAVPYSKEQIEVPNTVDKITTAEVIQKTVEKAAEAAIPIESLYERRHEIKGNDDFATSADAAISTVIEKPVGDAFSGDSNIHTSSVRLDENSQHGKTAVQNDLYGQAAKGGALLAILIIIAFLVVYMLN